MNNLSNDINNLLVLKYELEPFQEIASGRSIQAIALSRVTTREGVKWGVYMGDQWVLAKKEKLFILNPMPSSRTGSFRENTYFDSPEEALEFWVKYKNLIFDGLQRRKE